MLDHFARMGTARALPSTDLIRAAISPRPPDPNRFYWRNRRPSFPVAVAEFTCQQWRHREQEEHFSFRIALKLEVGTVEDALAVRSEEHTSELQSLMRISYAVFCLKKKKNITNKHIRAL